MIGRCKFLTKNISFYTPSYKSTKMPKQKVQSSSKNIKNDKKLTKNSEEGPVLQNKDGNISIKILAKPGAKANNITDISPDGVGVQISAPPMEGEANAELVKYLAGVFGLKKSEVTLDKGSKSRQKTIVLSTNSLTVNEVLEKLKSSQESS